MQENITKRVRAFTGHGDSDRKNSWYWSVLVKNMGSWAKAEKAVIESRKKADLFYDLQKVIKSN